MLPMNPRLIKQQMLSKHNKTIKAPERMSLRTLKRKVVANSDGR